MLSHLKLFTGSVALIFGLILNQNAVAQKTTITIKGNIHLTKENEWDIDECCFYYDDILSAKPVVIPIRRDTAGNYEVSFSIEHYHQVYFGKGQNRQGLSIYDTHMRYFTFFVKPGQKMGINFVQTPRKLKFSGDFAMENQQYQAYEDARDLGVKNIYQGVINKKLSPDEIKQHALNAFKEQLKFNSQYFKTHPATKFVKDQAYYQALYEPQSVAINFNFSSGNNITEAMVTDFYKAMKMTGNTFADRPGLSVAATDANPSLKNAAALGNDRYKNF
ncbi:hypothetical protein [Mucilaginibacter antarcticus]